MIDFKCTGRDREGDRCFIDFLIQIRNQNGHVIGIVFLEVDEGQHKWYGVECEVRRMADVHLSLTLEENTLPILFIRYNPHRHSKDGKTYRLLKRTREDRLVRYLRNVKFDQAFAVTYMFYDSQDGLPCVIDDPAYDESFKQVLGDCITA